MLLLQYASVVLVPAEQWAQNSCMSRLHYGAVVLCDAAVYQLVQCVVHIIAPVSMLSIMCLQCDATCTLRVLTLTCVVALYCT
jgi:hypothetical protein